MLAQKKNSQMKGAFSCREYLKMVLVFWWYSI